MQWDQWIKVVTHPLGLVGFGLALVFFILPIILSKRNISPWFPKACYITAMVVILAGLGLAYMKDTAKKNSSQSTTPGPYNPIIKDVNGKVTIEYKGVDPKVVKRLNELLEQKDKELGEAGLTIHQKIREANEWIKKYHELEASLENKSELSELDSRAKGLIEAGEFEKAGILYDRYLEKQDEQTAKLASANFKRGKVYDLLFQPLKALPYYAKAYHLKPEEIKYAHIYATLLYKQNQYNQAEPIFLKNLKTLRNLAEANPSVYQPDVARTLNNLGILYKNTQKHDEAEQAYKEALAIRRHLAEANPAAYQPDVAMTLNNLSILYQISQKSDEAEKALKEALNIYRKLAEANLSGYQPHVATTLNNLGNLYGDTKRYDGAKKAFKEALDIYRQLAKANPSAYQPDVAITLNNQGILYGDIQRQNEAEQAFKEALDIRRQFWTKNPAVHGDDLSQTLIDLANILFKKTGANPKSCELMREAEKVAYRDDLKQMARKFLDENC